jgi:hypothetical protein
MFFRCWIAGVVFTRFFAAAEAPSVQGMIDDAWKAGKKTVTIPPGSYRVTPPAHGAHLQLHGIENFEVDARSVTLIFTDQHRGGIEFRDCRNVKFRGATLRLETLPFTQGVVEAIAADGRFYDIRIEKGYPANFDDPKDFPDHPTGYLFDPKTRWWKRGIVDNSGAKIERLGPDRFRVYWVRPLGPPAQPVEIGDPMGFRGIGFHNVTVMNCARMDLTDLTITSAGSFAVLESGGDGGNHYSVAVKRGPRPPGAETDPLFSSTADAFHSVGVRQGPMVDHCYFEAMPDDGVAIHGTYSLVLQAEGANLVINKNTFKPGDPLRLFDPFGKPAGEAVVKSVEPLAGFENAKKSRRVTRSDNTRGPYFRITLDHPLPADFDFFASNPAAMGSGYIVRNNTIRNHRARGMLLKADNGLVEGNTVDGSTMGGIVITPEFWWNEACYSRNVTVRNNTIRNVAYWQRQWAGVVVAAIDKDPVPPGGHRNIVLEGNTIENVNGTNLFISSASGVIVRNNRFVNAQQEEVAVAGAHWGVDAGSLIFVTQADGVVFEGNTVIGRGRSGKALVQSTATAVVRGAETGVKQSAR